MFARSSSSSNGRDCAFVRNSTANSVSATGPRMATIFSMTNCASSRSLFVVTIRTGSPAPPCVKSVFPLRATLFETTPVAASRMLPVER